MSHDLLDRAWVDVAHEFTRRSRRPAMGELVDNPGAQQICFPVAAVPDNRLSISARWLFVYLCGAADSNDRAAMTVDHMALAAGSCASLVRSWLGELEAADWIKRETIYGRVHVLQLSGMAQDD